MTILLKAHNTLGAWLYIMAKVRTFDISEEIKKIIDEQAAGIMANTERALDKASEYMVQQLENATPADTGETKKAWITKDQYTGVRYIKNTRLNKKNIPVVNLLEFGAKGKPFVRKTFNANKNKVIEIIKGEIENG